jgi:uncharacterized membrane protein YsdA (DUF1294 family)
MNAHRTPSRDSGSARPDRRARRQRRGGISLPGILFLTALLVFPVLALEQLAHTVNVWVVFGYAALIPVAGFLIYRRDKRQAEAGEWRTPESRLHLVDLLGGWPGGFLAQRLLRHKNEKASFQVMFWAIVAAHQILAFDFLQSWAGARRLMQVLLG